MSDRVAIASIVRVTDGTRRTDQDLVAVESPLAVELRRAGGAARPLGLLMRTPGPDTEDQELVLGLLHAEGLIRRLSDVIEMRRTPAAGGGVDAMADAPDVMQVTVADDIDLDAVSGRAMLTTSACGLCGRLAIQAIGAGAAGGDPPLDGDLIARLPDELRRNQTVFAETGGLHAAGLFDTSGACLAIREDVGRHNAVDKIVGWAMTGGRLPAARAILAVSGRVAFEIVQKAVAAGIPAVVAVGAPSSLAVDAARAAHLTLVGFARDGRFNVYAGSERLR